MARQVGRGNLEAAWELARETLHQLYYINRHDRIYRTAVSSESHPTVTSSCLCKKVEGAGFPFQVESLEDGVADAVGAFYIDKANHGPGAAYFDEAASITLVVRSLRHRCRGESEERQQLRQVLLQPPHPGGISSAPARAKTRDHSRNK